MVTFFYHGGAETDLYTKFTSKRLSPPVRGLQTYPSALKGEPMVTRRFS